MNDKDNTMLEIRFPLWDGGHLWKQYTSLREATDAVLSASILPNGIYIVKTSNEVDSFVGWFREYYLAFGGRRQIIIKRKEEKE